MGNKKYGFVFSVTTISYEIILYSKLYQTWPLLIELPLNPKYGLEKRKNSETTFYSQE